jgi:hypothetical protein
MHRIFKTKVVNANKTILMKKIIYSIPVLLLILTGCYKDKSSTIYEPISAISVTGGINARYTLSIRVGAPLPVLTISPTVVSSDPVDDVANFKYLWTISRAWHGPASSVDTFAQTKNIDQVITLNPGTYYLLLRVTNPANGYSVYGRFVILDVVEEVGRGFFFLKETADGNTEMDFHIRTAWDETGTWSPVENILQNQFGAPLKGLPVSLGLSAGASGNLFDFFYVDRNTAAHKGDHIIVPTSSDDMKIINIRTMELIYSFDELFFAEGTHADHKPLGIFSPYSYGGTFILPTDKAVFYGTNTERAMGKFGPPSGVISQQGRLGKVFTVTAPYMINYFSGVFCTFDEVNNRLVFINEFGAVSYGTQRITDRPLYLGPGADAFLALSPPWGVWRDGEDPTKRYTYLLNTDGRRFTQRIEINPETAPNFNRAQTYGAVKVPSATQMIFGAVDDKLYSLNAAAASTALETPVDLEGLGQGEEITMVTYRPHILNPTSDERVAYLIVATYKNGNYNVFMYNVSETGEPFGAPVSIMTGQGKVFDMQFYGGHINYGYSPVR